jgi:hypothetical protein
MRDSKIQVVFLNDDQENSINCPFCGTRIANGVADEGIEEWLVNKCEHLLFAGYEEVVDYKSERFEAAVETALADIDEDDQPGEDDLYDLTQLVDIENAFMFHQRMGHPAEQSSYIGFAPTTK